MVRLTIFLAIVITSAILTAMKRAAARKLLAEIDAGKRCVACEGADVAVTGDTVRCQACGHVASLRALGAVQLNAREIDDMTRPDDRRL